MIPQLFAASGSNAAARIAVPNRVLLIKKCSSNIHAAVTTIHMYLTKHKLCTKKELDDIDIAVAKKMAKAVDFAMSSPEPDPAHVLDDVFYEG